MSYIDRCLLPLKFASPWWRQLYLPYGCWHVMINGEGRHGFPGVEWHVAPPGCEWTVDCQFWPELSPLLVNTERWILHVVMTVTSHWWIIDWQIVLLVETEMWWPLNWQGTLHEEGARFYLLHFSALIRAVGVRATWTDFSVKNPCVSSFEQKVLVSEHIICLNDSGANNEMAANVGSNPALDAMLPLFASPLSQHLKNFQSLQR